MGIYIKDISVQSLGPHLQFGFELGKFNLVYGYNENGKTYLVEFIIRSLFRQVKPWRLRQEQGRGKVRVAGLNANTLVEFSPISEQKLEDFWQESHPGLPTDFSKLLVVKGAEVAIARVAGGIDRNILKQLLSNRSILDAIQKQISKTIQDASIVGTDITGPRRGELSARQTLENQLKTIDVLLTELDKSYSAGPRKQLHLRLQKLEQEKQQMLRARRYLAFQAHTEINKLQTKCSRLSTATVAALRSELAMYRRKQQEYKQKAARQEEATTRGQNYEWLKNAQTVYQSLIEREARPFSAYWLALPILLIVAAGVLSYLGEQIYSLACLGSALITGVVFFIKYRRLLERLRERFYKLFGRELTGLPDLIELMQQKESDYNTARLLATQLRDELPQLHTTKLKLEEQFRLLAGSVPEDRAWEETVNDLEREARALETRLRDKELFLAQLNVDPADFIDLPPEVQYSQQGLEEIEQEIAAIHQKLTDATQVLASLKQRICQQTGDDIAMPWESIIANLRENRQRLLNEYRSITAEVLGKLAVNQEIEALRRDEDSKIVESLQSKIVQEPIFQLTHRYDNLSLDGERLTVSDQYNIFDVAELSTGAQEQILLGLRIGMSRKLMQEQSLFLILDDAFQYSDWQRRKWLVDKVADLAEMGWQIIYFTMDDNIRTLFEQKGKQFGEDFRMINLNKTKKMIQQLDLLS